MVEITLVGSISVIWVLSFLILFFHLGFITVSSILQPYILHPYQFFFYWVILKNYSVPLILPLLALSDIFFIETYLILSL